ncbi:Zinc-binding dehydrogenase [Phytophthora infestans]|uniref:Zinc-binding dehydrogenase n=1 Tax=Phytophthora infestans TaxID=4787 RepID=A0A8S9TZ82_PHYIN|nr:Zinc-binding dehydrogenase [Phytophthora infestans]
MASPQTFHAYQFESYGPMDKTLSIHSDSPQMPVGPNQVRIKMHSASVNPVDYMILEFAGEAFLKRSPSSDNPFTIGDGVYTMLPFSSFGTLAEYAVVSEECVAIKPSNLDFDEAAAVPLVAQTAYQGMFEHAKLQKGETVLIFGGSSSVGMYAVQFAHAIGVRVITTASADKADFLKSLGANQVIDYRTEKWQDVVEPHSVDAVYNCGMENEAWNEGAQNVLKKSTGRFVTILPMAQPVKESEFGAKLVGHVHVDPSAKTLGEITKYVESGKVKPIIDTIYPFEKALDAYSKLKSRHALGKLVVKAKRAKRYCVPFSCDYSTKNKVPIAQFKCKSLAYLK